MSVMLTGSVKERRHASTMNIDRLSTLDMLKVIHQDDALISAAITPCLDTIARVLRRTRLPYAGSQTAGQRPDSRRLPAERLPLCQSGC